MDWGNRKESLRYASATITDSGVPKSLTLDSLTTVQHGGIPIKQLVQLNIKEIKGYDIKQQPEVGEIPITRLPGGHKVEGVAPNIGTDTKRVMLDYGYSSDEIIQLNKEKVIFVPEVTKYNE